MQIIRFHELEYFTQVLVHGTTLTTLTYFTQRAAWRSGLHVELVMKRSWVEAPSKTSVVSLSNKLNPYCLVLVRTKLN